MQESNGPQGISQATCKGNAEVTMKQINLQILQLCFRYDVAVSLVEPSYSIANHFVNDSFCRLSLIHHRSNFAHQERTGVVHGIVIDVITHCFKIMLDRNFSLLGQFLNLSLALLLPVLNVWILSNP